MRAGMKEFYETHKREIVALVLLLLALVVIFVLLPTVQDWNNTIQAAQ